MKRPMAPVVRARGRTRRTPGTMNRLEKAYSETLEQMRIDGLIHAWAYEPMNLRLARKCFWKPDFLVVMEDGLVEFHECKGFMEGHAMVRIKTAAEKYPWFVIRVVKRRLKRDGGGFDVRVVGPEVE